MAPGSIRRGALLLLATCVAIGVLLWRWVHDPAYVVLRDGADASWLSTAAEDPLLLGHTGLNMAHFRTRIVVRDAPGSLALILHTTGAASLSVDGRPAFHTHASPSDITDDDIGRWNIAHAIALPPLEPGEHVLQLSLASFSGMPLFLLHGMPAGTVWESSTDAASWLPAEPAAVNAAYRRLADSLSLAWLRLNSSIPQGFLIDGTVGWLRQTWVTAAEPEPSQVAFSCLARCEAWLDGQPLPMDAAGHWKRATTLAIPALAAGRHELRIRAENPLGIPAVRVPDSSLFPGAWEASADGQAWRPARPLADGPRSAVSGYFPEVSKALVALAPRLLAIGLAFAALFALARRHPRFVEHTTRPRRVLGALLAAWFALGIHNLVRLPGDFGFDARHHLDYIRFVADYGAIPLPSDGWQMFQSPLYYLLSAALLKLAAPLWEGEELVRVLRILPLACGALQIVLVAWALRLAFPLDRRARNLGTLVGAFLPMSLYVSQSLGNEPLAGCLSALVICLGLRLILNPLRARFVRDCACIGAAWGLALLAKVTALLLAPVLLFVVLRSARDRAIDMHRAAFALLAVALACVGVCGWYYIGNWLAIGKPFVGGWDAERGILWVQPPGYRMPADLLDFGMALRYPVLAGVHGFWDGFYSTLWLDGLLGGNTYASESAMRNLLPWRPDLLVAGAGLAVAPALLMLRGLVHAAATDRPDLRLALIALGVYLLAMLQMYMLVPSYASLKASYTLGLLPCYALLVAAGIARWSRSPLARAMLPPVLCVWWIVVIATYWSR